MIEDVCLLNTMSTFELVIRPTDSRLALSFGAYMTLVSVIELCIGLEVILIWIVPHWLVVNESPLGVSMVMGGMLLRDWKSSRFPDRWLDVAESTSHM